MKSIAIYNRKGGSFKTTNTLNIGAALSKLGRKVLVIDFDSQANLTAALINSPKEIDKTLYDLLQAYMTNHKVNVYDYVISIKENLSLLPSSISLSAYENLSIHSDHRLIFKTILQQFKNYDYVLVDCPPSLSPLVRLVLGAVDELYIPIQPEYFSLAGLSQISEIIQAIHCDLNPDLKLGGLIISRYKKLKLHNDVMGYLRTQFPDKVFKTAIRESVAIAESVSHSKDIFSYQPKSAGAADYTNLGKEIIKLETIGA